MIGACKLKPGHYSFKSSIVFCCVNLYIQGVLINDMPVCLGHRASICWLGYPVHPPPPNKNKNKNILIILIRYHTSSAGGLLGLNNYTNLNDN